MNLKKLVAVPSNTNPDDHLSIYNSATTLTKINASIIPEEPNPYKIYQ